MVNQINKKIKNPKNKMKLPNGFGSISYLGPNRRNPFMMRAPATFDEYGKAKRSIIGYTDDWYKAMETLIIYNKDPEFEAKKELTFSEVFKLWTEYEKRRFEEKKKQGKLNPSQTAPYAPKYDSVFKNHCKLLQNKKLMTICSNDIQEAVDSCDKSFSIVRYILLVCGKVFLHGNRLGLKLDAGILKGIDIGHPTKSNMHTPFTDEEIKILWNNLGNHNVDPESIIDSILIDIYTGLRPTELVKQKSSKTDVKKQIMRGGIKTSAGIDREIPINNKIIPLVETRLKNNNEYLIADCNGNPYSYDRYLVLFRKVMKILGLNHKPHDCRNTTATKLYNAKVDELIYKLILGHAVTDVTEKHYITITTEQKIEAINKID